jgi:anaerobic selenocysteine-containing dehydrogenase
MNHCGMNAYVKDGKITRVDGMAEHPVSKGFLCVKGRQAADYVYAKDRLLYPMRKDDGGWKRISWDEALDIVAAKLKDVEEKHGAASFGTYIGEALEALIPTGGFSILRFMDVYGSPNLTCTETCSKVQMQAERMTFGMWLPCCQSPGDAECVILWGHNRFVSAPAVAQPITAARKRGAKLIVIDPRRTPSAKEADIHIQIRPGTDGALILGILHTIITEGLYHKDFVNEWTIGFDKLEERIRQYPPENAERITGVPAERIKEIARMYATSKPASILMGWTHIDQSASGFQAARAICILFAITGNLDIPGGSRAIAMAPINFMGLLDKWGEMPKAIGQDEYPMFSRPDGVWVFSLSPPGIWADAILNEKPYPMRAMVIAGCDPMTTAPNTHRFRRALEKLDFLVVMDIYMTPTAEMADIVLPATTFLERTDILHGNYQSIFSTPYALLGKKAIQEAGETWPDWRFWAELARRMGYDEFFPWQTAEELIDYYLEPSGLTVKQLMENPSGVPFGEPKDDEYFRQHPEEPRFPTPSGKIQLYCEALEQMGYDPLPSYTEPPESPVATPELASTYPLILTTGARQTAYKNRTLRNLPELRKKAPEAVVEIHPQDAEQYGIGDGDTVIAESLRGSIELRAQVTEDIMQGVIQIPYGWAEANVNVLTDDAPACKESGYPSLKSILCRVKRKE